MLHEEYIKSIIIITIMHYFMYAVVQFNFSTSELVIGENGNLQNELSIVKTGQQEHNISFRVFLTPITLNREGMMNSNGNYTV